MEVVVELEVLGLGKVVVEVLGLGEVHGLGEVLPGRLPPHHRPTVETHRRRQLRLHVL